MTSEIGETFTRNYFGKDFEFVRTHCRCGEEIEAFLATKGPRCQRCEAEDWRVEAVKQERKQRAALTLKTVPQHFWWARFDAPEFSLRIRPSTIIDKARGALDATSVVLLGRAGDGKTSLACALLREMAAHRETTGQFVTTFQLAEARRQNRLGYGEADVIKSAMRTGVLLLDELGAEQGRDMAVDEVIRVRHDEERPTIYTSGFSREQIGDRYGGGIERRVFENAIVLQLGDAR